MVSYMVYKGLYCLEGKYSSNTYCLKVSGGGHIIMIDPGCHELSILDGWLSRIGISANEITEVWLTHCHADHFLNAKVFKNAVIRASSIDGKVLLNKDVITSASAWFGNRYFPTKISDYYSDDLVKQDLPFDFIKTPGHTAGSICIYDKKNKALFSGDTLFKDNFGRYDLPTGNKQELYTSLKMLSNIKYEVLLSGHGDIYKTSPIKQKDMVLKLLNEF